MTNPTIKKIIAYEKVYNGKKSSGTAFVMATRYYMGYVISGQRDFLHKANFVVSAHANTADIPMVFLRTHIAYEMGHFDNAEDLLASLKPYRNAMKGQDAALYAHYLYFTCVLSIARGKERTANKHYRVLRDYCKERHPAQGNMLLAAANCAFGEFGTALEYLQLAHISGDKSPFFYICLARALENAAPGGPQTALLLPLIRWAFSSGLHINGIIARNQPLVEEILRRHPAEGEKLYAAYQLDWILYMVCTRKMIGNDLSPAAFAYYKEAEARQIHFPQLYDFLMRAAHKNGIEDISRYSLAQYLKMGTAPIEMLPFVYHLVLKQEQSGKNKEFLEKIKEDILQCAYHGVENRFYGRYYYSMYRYLLQAAISGEAIDKRALDFAEQTLKNLLFAYDISFGDNKTEKMLVQETHMSSEALYDVKGDKIRINLCGEDAKITCFDNNFRNIIDSKVKIQKLVENVDITILTYFFERGLDTPELLINLCLHHMEITDLSFSAIKIIEKVVANRQISAAFKMQARVVLGNFYAKNHNYLRAVQYYEHVDESRTAPKHLEQMLLAYIQSGEIGLAKRLVARAGSHIADKNLFTAIKRISSANSAATAGSKALAALAYKQLLRGWYDRGMLRLVLENHVASLAGWIELARSLSAMGEADAGLYMKILELAIRTRNGTGKNVQGIFAKLAELSPKDDILHDFAIYLTYEIIIGGIVPEYEAIHAMERLFNAHDDDYLAYGLAHVYLKNSITTGSAPEILHRATRAAMEADIIWPVFKEIKDKNLISPYIEKNMPFVYRGKAGHAVSLHYRAAGETDFAEVPMKYLRFGLFTCHIPLFYGEELEYYFKEAIATGSTTTLPEKIANNRPHLLEKAADLYYIINSALVYEQMFKYDKVEEIVTGRLAEKEPPRAKLL
jgi:hypothetical protein